MQPARSTRGHDLEGESCLLVPGLPASCLHVPLARAGAVSGLPPQAPRTPLLVALSPIVQLLP